MLKTNQVHNTKSLENVLKNGCVLKAINLCMCVCVYITGFVSIDCGIPEDSSYNDETTDIKYVSDAAFVESGDNP